MHSRNHPYRIPNHAVTKKAGPCDGAGFAEHIPANDILPMYSTLSFCLRDRCMRTLHLRPPSLRFSRVCAAILSTYCEHFNVLS